MRSLLLASLVAAAVATSIAVQQTASAQQQPADTILTNGKIITVDDQFSIAQAVAVRGDRIVAVGSTADITRLAGPATRRIDLRGRAVLPGFIDNHAHFQEEGAYWAHELRFDTITSRKEALEKIRAAAQKVGPGKWVYNYGGWSNDQFIDDKKLFTREELDKSSPDNPVYIQASRAETFVNSKAIEMTGLEKMTDPGIVRDANGRATGVVHGGGAIVRDAGKWLDAPNGERVRGLSDEAIRASSIVMMDDLNRAGLTSSGGSCQWEELHRDLKRMRFFCQQTAPGGRGAEAIEKQLALVPTLKYHDGDEWSDRTNWGEGWPGAGADDLYSATQQPVPQAQWDLWGRFAGEVAKAGIQAFNHSQTTENIDGKLAQLEKLQSQGISIRPLRWMLMHMEGVTPAQIERMKKLNMAVGVRSASLTMGGLIHRVHGDKAFAMPPLKEIQDSGIKWGFQCDCFEVNVYQPFYTLWWAVTGKMVGGTVVNTHTISREAALIGHTRNNAFLLFREADLGSIQNGKFADLIVIDRDYLTVPADQIKDINVMLTMVGGRVVYDAAAKPATAAR